MSHINFKKLSSAGTLVVSFNIRQEDVTPNSLSLLFRLVKDSIYLTTEANEVIFQDSSRDTNFPYLYGKNISLMAMMRLTILLKSACLPMEESQSHGQTHGQPQAQLLITRGLPAPLNGVVR